MATRVIWGSLLVAGVLAACGGGGSGGSSSSGGDGGKTASDTGKPASYAIGAPTVDDYVSYEVRVTTSKSGTTTPVNVSYRAEQLGYTPLGGSAWIEYNIASDQDQVDRFSTQLTEDRGILGHYYGDGRDSCTFYYKTPLRMMPSTIAIGQKWTLSFEGNGNNCPRIKDISPVSFTGQALAAETLTVKGGVFNTVKVGIEQSPVKQGNSSKAITYTIWRDALSGRDIKQMRSTTTTNLLNGQVEVEKYEEELIGLRIASTRQKKFALESLTGKWRGNFSSDKVSGYCHFLISAQGDMQGTCSPNTGGQTLALKGKISADGATKFEIGGGAAVLRYSGRFEQPWSAKDNWPDKYQSAVGNHGWLFVHE